MVRAPGSPVGTRLRDRERERALLDGLLSSVRRGESRSLVLRGEAGIGKTALLEYLVESASDLQVARATGVESEMELAFASLHQLCAPLLEPLERLPAPQRDALQIVFGLAAGPAPDRFLVGLAVLSLMSEMAEQRPLLCVVDDAQWLDQTSALTLAFVARRLLAEPVGLVFAAREPGEELQHVPDLEVRGLLSDDARALLESSVGFTLDDRVRDRVVAETRGNPLALVELPRGMTPTQLAGGFGMPEASDLSARIESSYARRLEDPPRRRATPVAGRSGRACRRPAAPAARMRPAGDLAVRGRRHGRVAGGGGAGGVPPSAGALGRVPIRRRAGAESRPPGTGAGHGSRRRSGSPRMASRCCGPRARRGRGA